MTDDQLKEAWRIVPFAFGFRPKPDEAGGLVHNWETCSACHRDRTEALRAVDAEAAWLSQ